MKNIETMSSAELQKMILSKQMSVRELTEFQIQLVQKHNTRVNAVAEERFAVAIHEAKIKDQELSKGTSSKLPELFGVPFTFKEMFSFPGMKQTLGSYYRKDFRARQSATVVDRLMQAGGIPICTTNVPELGFWFECGNVLYGETRNPYDPSRTSGGSSGGEAALIGSGASPFGLGSDIGGSIRIPSAFCGIFGHKPTNRRVPMSGHYPIDPLEGNRWSDPRYPLTVAGPMARRAEDLRVLMKLIAGPDGVDPCVQQRVELGKPWTQRGEDLRGLAVYLLPSPSYRGAWSTDADVADAVVTAGRALEKRGARLIELNQDRDLPLLSRGLDFWFDRVEQTEKDPFKVALGNGQAIPLLREGLRFLTGQPRHTFPAYLTAVLEEAQGKLNSTSGARVLRSRVKLRSDFGRLSSQAETLLKSAVLLTPVHPRVAPQLKGTYCRPFDFVYTAVWNALGYPATTAPVGLVGDLPSAVQIVSAPDCDDCTLGIAEILEQELGGWRAPRE